MTSSSISIPGNPETSLPVAIMMFLVSRATEPDSPLTETLPGAVIVAHPL